jgi:hypothetical protein
MEKYHLRQFMKHGSFIEIRFIFKTTFLPEMMIWLKKLLIAIKQYF